MSADDDRRTAGLPGAFSDFNWVDSTDYGDSPDERRLPRLDDVDPAPLARLMCVFLGLIDGDLADHMRAIASDERDGPIHLVHLLAACEYAARQIGGGIPAFGAPRGSRERELVTSAVSGPAVPALAAALREGGLPAATAMAREIHPQLRYEMLDGLLGYWAAPITALRIPLTNASLGVPRLKNTRLGRRPSSTG